MSAIPPPLEYLWRWFLEILAGIASTGLGVGTVGWPDIKAWCDLMGVSMEPWESRTIIQLSMQRAIILSEKTVK
jgi:hypothetical protein